MCAVMMGERAESGLRWREVNMSVQLEDKEAKQKQIKVTSNNSSFRFRLQIWRCFYIIVRLVDQSRITVRSLQIVYYSEFFLFKPLFLIFFFHQNST